VYFDPLREVLQRALYRKFDTEGIADTPARLRADDDPATTSFNVPSRLTPISFSTLAHNSSSSMGLVGEGPGRAQQGGGQQGAVHGVPPGCVLLLPVSTSPKAPTILAMNSIMPVPTRKWSDI